MRALPSQDTVAVLEREMEAPEAELPFPRDVSMMMD